MIVFVGLSSAVQHIMLLDRAFVPGRRVDVRSVQWCAAGKSCNAAKVAHALGEPAHVITPLGGSTGRWLERDLAQRGVSVDAVAVEQATRICSTLVCLEAQQATECIEPTPPIDTQVIEQVYHRLGKVLGHAKVLVLSGSLAPGAPVDFYAVCTQLAHQHGVAVIVDAAGDALSAAIGQRPTLVKPNRAELAQTAGRPIQTDQQLKQAIEQLLNSGPQWAAVTDGADRTLLSDGRSFWQAKPPSVKLVSPIGSGDAFAGAMAVAMARRMPMPDALRLAVAAGSANAAQLQPGMVNPAQVAVLFEQIAADPL